ncbi:MAG: alanine racemase [Steroidobacteraceae bacterium]
MDTAALRHNLSRVREFASGCRVLAVIKANAYGHGLVTVAEALAEADGFAVARLEEAITLRAAGCAARIVLLEGVQDAGELEEAARLDLELFVHQVRQIELLEGWRGAHFFRVWLKIDSGMHRLGFPPGDAAAVTARLGACGCIARPLQLATHLAEAEKAGSAETRAQIERFTRSTADLSGERSIANSAGLIAWPESRADWVRPGIMLYGISPFPETTGADLGLKPVMTFESRVIAIRDVVAGDRVGYGGTWTATRAARIAIAAVGYGDGYPRAAGNGTPVEVNGRVAFVAGCPSMDMLTVDVTDLPRVGVGDRVELWGENVPVERVAAAAGTIAYELTCRVGRRVTFSTRGS